MPNNSETAQQITNNASNTTALTQELLDRYLEIRAQQYQNNSPTQITLDNILINLKQSLIFIYFGFTELYRRITGSDSQNWPRDFKVIPVNNGFELTLLLQDPLSPTPITLAKDVGLGLAIIGENIEENNFNLTVSQEKCVSFHHSLNKFKKIHGISNSALMPNQYVFEFKNLYNKQFIGEMNIQIIENKLRMILNYLSLHWPRVLENFLKLHQPLDITVSNHSFKVNMNEEGDFVLSHPVLHNCIISSELGLELALLTEVTNQEKLESCKKNPDVNNVLENLCKSQKILETNLKECGRAEELYVRAHREYLNVPPSKENLNREEILIKLTKTLNYFNIYCQRLFKHLTNVSPQETDIAADITKTFLYTAPLTNKSHTCRSK